MPEGDTVYVAARRLDRALAGSRLTGTDFRVPRYATADLSGRGLDEVRARGKHLLFRFGGGLTLHTHFRMDGAWHLYRPGSRWRGPAFEVRAVLSTSQWIAVGFRLPVIDLLATSEEGGVVGHLGPDLLGDDWDPVEATRRLSVSPARPVAEALLDQRAVAGWGNVYKCEICFLRGVNPWTPVARIEDLGALVNLGHKLISANRRSARQVTTGDPRPGRSRWVYGRLGKPCRRCGTLIRRAGPSNRADDRVTYWCPRCQPPALPID